MNVYNTKKQNSKGSKPREDETKKETTEKTEAEVITKDPENSRKSSSENKPSNGEVSYSKDIY